MNRYDDSLIHTGKKKRSSKMICRMREKTKFPRADCCYSRAEIAHGPTDVDPDHVGGGPFVADEFCDRRRSSPVFVWMAEPDAAFPYSSTSTQLPPRWLPVLAGTQTKFFPFFCWVVACTAATRFRSKLSSVA